MKHTNEDLSLATKVKIVGSMALVSALVVVSTGVGVALQKENKLQAAELAKTQLANVEAMKTAFPSFRDSKQFKESAKMAIVKISVEDLPATITAGLDETVTPNPFCETFVSVPYGTWEIRKGSIAGEIVGTNDGGAENGWVFLNGGSVSIPAGAEYGKYYASYLSNELCTSEGGSPDDGHLHYIYTFKITPPCPTGVTLTHASAP